MDLLQIARMLGLLGLAFLVIAGVIYLLTWLDLPLGRLPGDIVIKRENFTCVFPLVTSLVLSIVLTILFNLVVGLLRK